LTIVRVVKQAGLRLLAKKVVDKVAAAGVLIGTAPILGAAALAVRATMGGPVLFTQPRPGLGGKTFRIYKLRTMTSERDARGELLPDDVRLTALGKFLRRASIDELPQLINVVLGGRSLQPSW
jgi:sugar transferase EpsL